MSKLWVVVADQSRARIFTVTDPHGELLDIGELEHPEAREKEQAMTTDRPGRAFDSKGQGRHAMGPEDVTVKQGTIRFVKQVVDHMQAAHNEGRCNRVLLVAGPTLLGLLRDSLKNVSGLKISEIEKNLGQYDAREIRKHLPNKL